MAGFVKGKQFALVRKHAEDRCHIALKARLIAFTPKKLLPNEQLIRVAEDHFQNIEHSGVSLRHIVPASAVEKFHRVRQVRPAQVIAADLIEDQCLVCRYFGQLFKTGRIQLHTKELHQIVEAFPARGPVLINTVLLEGGHDVAVTSVPRILRHQMLHDILFLEKCLDIRADIPVAGHLNIYVDVGQEIVGNPLYFRTTDHVLNGKPCIELSRIAQLFREHSLADHNIPGIQIHPHGQMLQKTGPDDLGARIVQELVIIERKRVHRIVTLAVRDHKLPGPAQKIEQFVIDQRPESELNDAVMVPGHVDEPSDLSSELRIEPCVSDLRFLPVELEQVERLDVLFLPAVDRDQVVHDVVFEVLILV